jgi:hypothetical protein
VHRVGVAMLILSIAWAAWLACIQFARRK